MTGRTEAAASNRDSKIKFSNCMKKVLIITIKKSSSKQWFKVSHMLGSTSFAIKKKVRVCCYVLFVGGIHVQSRLKAVIYGIHVCPRRDNISLAHV